MNILSVSSTEIICFHFVSQSSPFVAIIPLIFIICVIYCERFIFVNRIKGVLVSLCSLRFGATTLSITRRSIAIGLRGRQSLSFNDNRKGEDSLCSEMRLTSECR